MKVRVRIAVGALALLMTAPTHVAGQSAAPPSSVIPPELQPYWARKPTGKDVGRVYPRAALMQGVAGQVIIKCMVKADGNLDACSVEHESPKGRGFGEAALRLQGRFQMASPPGGEPVGGATVTIPIAFSAN